ncbi:MAG: diacylglycerol kinase family protein [Kineosporiaceae bacterium]
MTRIALVVNPVGVDDAEALQALLRERCEQSGWDAPLILETTAEDPGAGMARQALDAGVERVLVAGGDGTVRTVAEELLGSGVALGILPAGTGNLLARNLDLPLDLAQALELALSGPTRTIDAGQVADGAAFVVMAGMGLDAAMMQEAPDALKAKIGWPAYLVGGVRGLRRGRFRVEISLDGGPALRRRVSTVVVGNVGTLQGGLALLPEARPDDGLLDVCVVAPDTPLQWAAVLTRLLTHRPPRPHDRRLDRWRAADVSVRAAHPQARQVDGDPIDDGSRLDLSVRASGLVVVAPHPDASHDDASHDEENPVAVDASVTASAGGRA